MSTLADLAIAPGVAAGVADNLHLIACVRVGAVQLDMERPEHLALLRLGLAAGGRP
jgi:hypothetical protein